MVSREFWRNKVVFLTGHTGFKGSWMSLWLNELGAHIVGYALPPPTKPALFDLAGVEGLVEHRVGDVRDAETLAAAVAAAQPDIVIHMAAQPLVRLSYAMPVETYATNVMGTVHLLDAVRRTQGVRAVVCVTSDKCYDNREWDWGYRESDPMGGFDPYSNSKGCAELIIAAYRQSFFPPQRRTVHGVALASARAGNVVGGGDWAQDRLVPDILRALSQGRRPCLRYPEALRPWQHVLDCLAGYLRLVECLYAEGGEAYASAWNFGPRDEDIRPVRYVADRLCRLWEDGAGWDRDEGAHVHEATLLKLDISKARKHLDWAPTWRLDDALAEAVAFTKAWRDGADMRTTIGRHIAWFEEGRGFDDEYRPIEAIT